jgi:hypothetical protein
MTTRNESKRNPLEAITSSLLALTGIAGTTPAAADAPPEGVRIDYSFSSYNEDSISSSDQFGGDDERYEIEIHQFSYRAPWGEKIDIGLDLAYETMSGASPWFTLLDPNGSGEALQAMSGATIDDDRTDFTLSGNYYLDNGRIGLATGLSTEKDYDAINLSVDWERHFNNKNTTLSAGLGLSFDEIDPTDDPTIDPTRPTSEDKETYTLFVGASQILSRNSLLQGSLTYKYSDGYLSDPYKLVYFTSTTSTGRDLRPDSRHQWALLTRYRRHVPRWNGSFHGDYRVSFDDWGIVSHTLEFAWHQQVLRSLKLVPSLRYYSQSEADFYAPWFTAPGSEQSSDYRLSPYGAFSYGLKAETFFKTPWTGRLGWRAALEVERYVSDGDYALVEVDVENPGLVSFTVVSLNLTTRF